jgi:hypothetical protein
LVPCPTAGLGHPKGVKLLQRNPVETHQIQSQGIEMLSKGLTMLVAFRQRCRELDEQDEQDELDVTPDIRHDLNTVRARFDTYRGCRIQALYEITEGQVQELLDLGEKSGK